MNGVDYYWHIASQLYIWLVVYTEVTNFKPSNYLEINITTFKSGVYKNCFWVWILAKIQQRPILLEL